MILLSMLRVSLFATFYSVLVISLVSCDTQSSQDENLESTSTLQSTSVTKSEQDTTTENYDDINKLLQFFEQNFKEVMDNDQEDPLSSIEDNLHGLNLRSLSHSKTDKSRHNGDASDSESYSKSDYNEDEEYPEQERNVRRSDKQQQPMNFPNVFRNGLFDNEDASPQLIRKFFSFVMDRLNSRLKPNDDDDDEDDRRSNHRFPRKLLEHGKHVLHNVKETAEELAPVGIHRALKLGPWSLNFDMGRP